MNETPKKPLTVRQFTDLEMAVFYEKKSSRLETELADKEKQLAEARARIDHLERIVDEMTEEQAALCAEDQTIAELVATKDKLIEQMREALSLILEGAIHDFHYACQHRNSCLCWGCQKKRVNAALAAERGE